MARTTTVSSGITSSGLTISSTNSLTVLNGGTVSATQVLAGGTETISSGGKSYGDVISAASLTTSSSTQILMGGYASGTTLSSGGYQVISSGGVASHTDLLAGSLQDVFAGGSAVLDTVAGGRENVSSGGVDISATVQSGNIMWIYAGGSGTGEIISGGASSLAEISNAGTTTNVSVYVSGSEVVSAGGVANSTSVFSGGTLTVSSGGSAKATAILSGGSETVSAGGSESGSIVSSGGTETIASGGAITGGAIAGGLLDIQAGAVVSGAITFSNVAGTLEIDGTTMPTNVISGFSVSGDGIILGGVTSSTSDTLTVSGSTVTVTAGATSYSLSVAGATASNVHLASHNGTLELLYAPCFLRGTRIATPHGERRMEELAQGDMVSVLADGAILSRPIVWIGSRAVTADDFAHRKDAHPVRIFRHAFAENVPHRDLLVTPEHCILVDGRLIPARMLVNGHSIILDRGITEYEFFHIELAEHGILLSEGLTTESYLDTGNRDSFGDTEASLPEAPRMAAPLAVDRETVEPIWRRLLDRAAQLGFETAATARSGFSMDPQLRLLLDDGRELTARWHDSMRHMFHIPHGARPLRLLSRTAVPAEAVGPFCDDRRRLGVAVERMVLWSGLDEVPLRLESVASDGWHAPEAGCRWTDGSAGIDVPQAACPETFVDVQLNGTMEYPLTAQLSAQAAA